MVQKKRQGMHDERRQNSKFGLGFPTVKTLHSVRETHTKQWRRYINDSESS